MALLAVVSTDYLTNFKKEEVINTAVFLCFYEQIRWFFFQL